MGLRVNISDNVQSGRVRGFIPGSSLAEKASETTPFISAKAARDFETSVRYIILSFFD